MIWEYNSCFVKSNNAYRFGTCHAELVFFEFVHIHSDVLFVVIQASAEENQ